jgi:hypothetical protein
VTVLIAQQPIDLHVEGTLRRKALLTAWLRWREAVRAHVAAIRAEGRRPELDRFPENIRWVHLPTFAAAAGARYMWMDEVAAYRAAHPRTGTEGAAHVAKIGHRYEPVCDTHPRFRRVAWSRPGVPARAARKHNVEHHAGAPVVVIARSDREATSLIAS